MAHIAAIGAGMFSDISFSTDLTTGGWSLAAAPTFSEANWKALFASAVDPGTAGGITGKFRRLTNIREMPQFGTPPNIVNVPTYGFKTSKQVQGQSDAPTFEIMVNFVPSDWQTATDYLGNYLNGGVQYNAYPFRIVLLNAAPTLATAAQYASTAPGVGSVANTQYYFGGRLEAIQINPQLTDSNQATVTVSVQTDFYGPWTI